MTEPKDETTRRVSLSEIEMASLPLAQPHPLPRWRVGASQIAPWALLLGAALALGPLRVGRAFVTFQADGDDALALAFFGGLVSVLGVAGSLVRRRTARSPWWLAIGLGSAASGIVVAWWHADLLGVDAWIGVWLAALVAVALVGGALDALAGRPLLPAHYVRDVAGTALAVAALFTFLPLVVASAMDPLALMQRPWAWRAVGLAVSATLLALGAARTRALFGRHGTDGSLVLGALAVLLASQGALDLVGVALSDALGEASGVPSWVAPATHACDAAVGVAVGLLAIALLRATGGGVAARRAKTTLIATIPAAMTAALALASWHPIVGLARGATPSAYDRLQARPMRVPAPLRGGSVHTLAAAEVGVAGHTLRVDAGCGSRRVVVLHEAATLADLRALASAQPPWVPLPLGWAPATDEALRRRWRLVREHADSVASVELVIGAECPPEQIVKIDGQGRPSAMTSSPCLVLHTGEDTKVPLRPLIARMSEAGAATLTVQLPIEASYAGGVEAPAILEPVERSTLRGAIPWHLGLGAFLPLGWLGLVFVRRKPLAGTPGYRLRPWWISRQDAQHVERKTEGAWSYRSVPKTRTIGYAAGRDQAMRALGREVLRLLGKSVPWVLLALLLVGIPVGLALAGGSPAAELCY